MENYRKLLRFLKGHVKILVLASVFMFCSALFDGFQMSLIVPITDKILSKSKIILPTQAPAFLQNLIDHVNALEPMVLLRMMIIGVIVIFLLKSFFVFWHRYLMSMVSQRVMRDVRSRLYETLQNLSLDYFSKKRSGELIARITNDVQVIENSVSYAVTDFIYQSFRIVMFTSIIFFIHLKLALMVFGLFGCVAWPMYKIGKKLKKLSKQTQEKMADINSILVETISGVRIVKAFNMEEYESGRFRQQNQDFYKVKMKTIMRQNILSPITEFIGVLFGLIVFWWMGTQVLKGQVSFGVFALFFGSLMSIISPLKKLSNVNAITQQAIAASERIYDVLDAKPSVAEKDSACELAPIQDQIKIDHVTFIYDQDSEDVLHDIHLDIDCGDLVAIVGPTGAGKSTLANLIPRFYDPRQGRVVIDHTDLKDATFKSLRRQIGIVTQETILFNDTVKANIAYGHLEASLKQIEDAAHRAYAHQFIVDMPNGYDTVIGDRGFRLSGGEKQRIAIARAILKNPPILILDEATSQLDSQSEEFVQDALDKLMKGRTVICIAHRLSTIKKATKIVVLQDGKIVGLGKHEELLGTCPLYKKLHDTQFQM